MEFKAVNEGSAIIEIISEDTESNSNGGIVLLNNVKTTTTCVAKVVSVIPDIEGKYQLQNGDYVLLPKSTGIALSDKIRSVKVVDIFAKITK